MANKKEEKVVKAPVLKKKYEGLVYKGKIYKNPLTKKDAEVLEKAFGKYLFEVDVK